MQKCLLETSAGGPKWSEDVQLPFRGGALF